MMTTGKVFAFTGRIESFESGDRGQFKAVEVTGDGPPVETWVRICSYREDGLEHPLIDALVEKTVRVTIEVLDTNKEII